MASFNKITIVGYLGRDPEMRYTPDGKAACSFSVATTEKRRDEDVTTWFRVTVWERLAEVANEYLSKGKQVYVEGRIRLSEYTDRDGNRRASLEVTGREIQFLGNRGDNEDGGRRSNVSEGEANRAATKAALSGKQSRLPGTGDGLPRIDDDDIPF